MEIALHAQVDEPYLEHLPGDRVRVHADISHNIEELLAKFAHLSHRQLQELQALWGDPETDRKFTDLNDFVLIRKN
jgi:hypothetical protein